MTQIKLQPEIKKLRAKVWQEQPKKDSDNHDPLDVRAGASTTSDVDLLRLEAELMADGRELDNPHIPIDTETLQEAQTQITADGNKPAWSQ